MMRAIVAGALVLSCLLPAGAQAAGGGANEYLLSQPPSGQASTLAKVVGANCTGRTAFYMGMGISAGTKNQAFWSLKCSSGDTYVVEVNRDGSNQVLRCSAYEINDTGKCFKKLGAK